MANVEIYTKSWCPFRAHAKAHLVNKGVDYQEIDVTTYLLREAEMFNRSGRTSLPQIFIGDYYVGGNDDLAAAEASGLLDLLLAETSDGAAA